MGLFTVFSNNEKDKNRSHIKNLLEVAIADGKLDESELNLVMKIASNFDMTKEEVLDIKNNSNDVSFNPPSSYSAKIKLLEDLVNVMIADKSIHESEVEICKEFALRLNISPVIIDDIILSILNSNDKY